VIVYSLVNWQLYWGNWWRYSFVPSALNLPTCPTVWPTHTLIHFWTTACYLHLLVPRPPTWSTCCPVASDRLRSAPPASVRSARRPTASTCRLTTLGHLCQARRGPWPSPMVAWSPWATPLGSTSPRATSAPQGGTAAGLPRVGRLDLADRVATVKVYLLTWIWMNVDEIWLEFEWLWMKFDYVIVNVDEICLC
jgi:hypothetical protein